MRLIDADAILQDVQEQIALTKTLFPDEGINIISKMLEDTFKKQIEKMPTVEAIPMEWIKKWVNKYCDRYQENLIDCLLRTWRKENEAI